MFKISEQLACSCRMHPGEEAGTRLAFDKRVGDVGSELFQKPCHLDREGESNVGWHALGPVHLFH
jgi:hypothetical protein